MVDEWNDEWNGIVREEEEVWRRPIDEQPEWWRSGGGGTAEGVEEEKKEEKKEPKKEPPKQEPLHVPLLPIKEDSIQQQQDIHKLECKVILIGLPTRQVLSSEAFSLKRTRAPMHFFTKHIGVPMQFSHRTVYWQAYSEIIGIQVCIGS